MTKSGSERVVQHIIFVKGILEFNDYHNDYLNNYLRMTKTIIMNLARNPIRRSYRAQKK